MLPLYIDETLFLRLLSPQHGPALFRLINANRRHLEPWLYWIREIQTIEAMDAYLVRTEMTFANGKQAHFGIWSVGELVGSITVERISTWDKTAEIGYWLSRSHIGKGLMVRSVKCLGTWLFTEQAINRIEIRCDASNQSSCSVATRAGFIEEGTLRQAGFHDGTYRDHRIFSLLRKDALQTQGYFI